ncbi:unnamed protein product [Menidia menidia]|uniref:(Atlantic silverside) hypothetical protein n=1 Tax=Menidia menidia TaxID=238744 RepID=A0A8S4B4X7_9TELE|nr:unnamed protein product [Menidia menidia]
MDRHLGREEYDVENQTVEENIYPTDFNETENCTAKVLVSDHEIRTFSSTREPEENPGYEGHSGSNEELDVKVTYDQSVVFETGDGDNAPLSLNLERETPNPTEGDEKQESTQLLQDLCKQRDRVGRRNRQLQVKLAEYLGRGDGQLEEGRPAGDQVMEYQEHTEILADLNQELCSESEAAQRRAEELRLESQQKLDKVEAEWRAFVAVKRDAAVWALTRRLGQEAARAKVDAVLATEQLREDELVRAGLRRLELGLRVRRLEAELRHGGGAGRDPLQVQFERLQAERLERKRRDEKDGEVALRLRKKMAGCLEVLANVREKLYWSLTEVETKRERLAEVEALLAEKRDLLTRTKRARNGLQGDNLRLRECRGLLGNAVLLRDFQDTADASEHLEKHLENLKNRRAEIAHRHGGRRSKLGAA